MWISNTEYARMNQDREQERSLWVAELVRLGQELTAATTRAAQSQRDMDWLRIRVNALEQERTALLLKVNGVLIPTPQIVREREPEFSPDELKAIATVEQVGQDIDDGTDRP